MEYPHDHSGRPARTLTVGVDVDSTDDLHNQCKLGETTMSHVGGARVKSDSGFAADVPGERRGVEAVPCIGHMVRGLKKVSNRFVPPGGHISNIFNMSSTTLGIGIVSMPSGFNTAGICLAPILMIVCAVLVVFSFYLIGVTCERSPYRTWESACRGILFHGAEYVVAGVMIFFQVGTMVGYVTSLHDLIGPFIEADNVSPFLKTPHGRRLLSAIVWFFGMFLVCLPRRVASLRYFSIIGVMLVMFFVVAVVAHSSMAGLPHVHDLKYFATGIDAVSGLTLFIFAFLSHGLCFRFFDEMRVQSARNIALDDACSVTLVSTLYFVVGFFGYAEFGLDISGSIFKYYHVRGDAMMLVAYVGILLKICVAYALCCQACRLPICYILRRNIDSCPLWLHLSITVSLCVCTFIIGIFVPDVNIVFNLLGSICGGMLAFLLPAFLTMYLGGWTVKRVGWVRVSLTYVNIIAGVVAIVFGTAVAVDGIVRR